MIRILDIRSWPIYALTHETLSRCLDKFDVSVPNGAPSQIWLTDEQYMELRSPTLPKGGELEYFRGIELVVIYD